MFARVLMVLAVLGLALPAFAEEKISPALQKVIEAAKKEGELKIQWTPGRLGGDVGLRKMVSALNKRYGTDLKVRYTPGPSFPRMTAKLLQEQAAGQPASSDIHLGTSNHISQGTAKGMLTLLDWEGLLERPNPKGANINRTAPKGAAVAIASRVVGISYNSRLVKGDDVPKSMEDVFKPKFKGKIASTPYATGLYQFAADDMLGRERMTDYTRRLAAHIGGLMLCNAQERIASGEFLMLVFDCGHDDALRMTRKGAPVKQATIKEISRVNVMYLGVPKHAQHPNAATLFVNFMNTAEGQKLQWDLGGHDLHIYPEANTRKPVLDIVKGGGLLFIDTVERNNRHDPKALRKIQAEFRKILKKGGK